MSRRSRSSSYRPKTARPSKCYASTTKSALFAPDSQHCKESMCEDGIEKRKAEPTLAESGVHLERSPSPHHRRTVDRKRVPFSVGSGKELRDKSLSISVLLDRFDRCKRLLRFWPRSSRNRLLRYSPVPTHHRRLCRCRDLLCRGFIYHSLSPSLN